MNRRHQVRSARAAAPSFHPALTALRSHPQLTACGVYLDLSGRSHHHRKKGWAFGISPSPPCPLPKSLNPTSSLLFLSALCALRAKSKSSAKELPFVFMLLRTLPFSVHHIFPSKLFAFNPFRTLSEKHGGGYQLFPKWNASAPTRSRRGRVRRVALPLVANRSPAGSVDEE